MKTAVLALSITAAFAAAPVAIAQSHTAAGSCTPEHAAMGHCTLPQTPAGAHDHGAPAAPDACTPEHAAMGHCTLPQLPAGSHDHGAPATPAACTPEHAAMGHCTLPETAAGSHDHHAQAAPAGCTPEHAAMGHCTLPQTAAGSHDHGAHAAPAGCTPEHAAMGHCRMPAPRAPRTPIPVPTDADRAAAFPVLHHHSMEHASPVHSMVLFDRLEAWDAAHGSGQAWDVVAWVGTDLDRLWLRSEGERDGGRTGSADIELLYGRSVLPWWDVVVGLRQDMQPHARRWAAFGVQGLAPHFLEISATAYVGSGGQVQLKAEAEYDVRLTNRLILQPQVEVVAALENEPDAGIGSGLGKIESGLRLRYEISRRFAPYVGVVHERQFGTTAAYARAAGGHARDTRVVAGVRLWF